VDWFVGHVMCLNRFQTFTLQTLVQNLAPYRCGVQLNWKYLKKFVSRVNTGHDNENV
jgi:hypothetical protein